MVLGRPLITSDHRVLREYYGDCALYAEPTPASLASAIAGALDQADTLQPKLAALRKRRAEEWRNAAARLDVLVGRPS